MIVTVIVVVKGEEDHGLATEDRAHGREIVQDLAIVIEGIAKGEEENDHGQGIENGEIVIVIGIATEIVKEIANGNETENVNALEIAIRIAIAIDETELLKVTRKHEMSLQTIQSWSEVWLSTFRSKISVMTSKAVDSWPRISASSGRKRQVLFK